MKIYHGGNSGVASYEVGDNFMVIQFRSGERYLYNHLKPGRQHVQAMKWCAAHNAGLATYISQHVRNNFAAKLGPNNQPLSGEGPSRPPRSARISRAKRTHRPAHPVTRRGAKSRLSHAQKLLGKNARRRH